MPKTQILDGQIGFRPARTGVVVATETADPLAEVLDIPAQAPA
jgi:hypothetical protein